MKRIQEFVGTIMHCCRVTEFMPLVALSSISFQQSKATKDATKALKRCLDYLFTFSNGSITCTASNMILWVCSNRVCLVEPSAKSRAGRCFFLSNFIKDMSKATPKLNSPIHVLCEILKNIVSSAAKCKIVAVFENG